LSIDVVSEEFFEDLVINPFSHIGAALLKIEA
jgi:hypothetical protein